MDTPSRPILSTACPRLYVFTKTYYMIIIYIMCDVPLLEKEKFEEICDKVIREAHESSGIGTLNEKTLHSVIKNYIEPDKSRQEVKIDRFVADIFRDDQVIEIQTRNFYGMKKKLSHFLEKYPVTVVYPIPNEKHINWIDPSTGEIVERRKSPKKPHPQEMAHELIHILPFLTHENLSFRIMYLDVEDYKLKNGWDASGKKGSERYERIPKRLIAEKIISCAKDYLYFIPEDLPGDFTVKEFAKKAHVTKTCASRMLYILMKLGVVERPGKRGRGYIYRITCP
jgi:hypothetical protein